nr:immunoglobulin heavy chain junction region [Mus musculus]
CARSGSDGSSYAMDYW